MPHGGSKQAAMFAGPRTLTIRGRSLTEHHNALCLPDGRIQPAAEPPPPHSGTVFALAAGPDISLASFLTARLPFIVAALPAWPGAHLAGAPPTPAQAGVLAHLGLTELHLPLAVPHPFHRVIDCRTTPEHGAPADEDFIRMMSQLRAAPGSAAPTTVAILPGLSGQRFSLRNRASLSAWLRARRVGLLAPESEPFAATANTLANAAQVLIADTRDAGLLGLCARGTKILEIAPEGWAGGTIRTLCAALGLEWHLLLASPPSYPVLHNLPFGAATALSYDIPIATLAQTLAKITPGA